MTISSEDRKAGPYDGNGVATLFPFAFKVIAAEYVAVYHTTPAGAESLMVGDGVDYSVSLNPDQEDAPGGFVQTVTPLLEGAKLTITSEVPNLQPLALTNQGGFYPHVINAALDRLTILVQQLAARIGRTLRAPISDPDISMVLPGAAERANTILAFDATGRPVTYPLDGVTPGNPGGSGGTHSTMEVRTATAGQTVFTLTNAYTPANNSLSVYVNGLRNTRGLDYAETSATRVTFVEGLDAGDRVMFVVGVEVTTGTPGSGGGTTSLTPDVALGGHRIVSSAGGQIQHADCRVLAHASFLVGLTLFAVDAGNPVTVRSSGLVDEPSWAWNVSLPVYLGADGVLSQSVHASAAFVCIVGFPVSPTSLFLALREPIAI